LGAPPWRRTRRTGTGRLGGDWVVGGEGGAGDGEGQTPLAWGGRRSTCARVRGDTLVARWGLVAQLRRLTGLGHRDGHRAQCCSLVGLGPARGHRHRKPQWSSALAAATDGRDDCDGLSAGRVMSWFLLGKWGGGVLRLQNRKKTAAQFGTGLTLGRVGRPPKRLSRQHRGGMWRVALASTRGSSRRLVCQRRPPRLSMGEMARVVHGLRKRNKDRQATTLHCQACCKCSTGSARARGSSPHNDGVRILAGSTAPVSAGSARPAGCQHRQKTRDNARRRLGLARTAKLP